MMFRLLKVVIHHFLQLEPSQVLLQCRIQLIYLLLLSLYVDRTPSPESTHLRGLGQATRGHLLGQFVVLGRVFVLGSFFICFFGFLLDRTSSFLDESVSRRHSSG